MVRSKFHFSTAHLAYFAGSGGAGVLLLVVVVLLVLVLLLLLLKKKKIKKFTSSRAPSFIVSRCAPAPPLVKKRTVDFLLSASVTKGKKPIKEKKKVSRIVAQRCLALG